MSDTPRTDTVLLLRRQMYTNAGPTWDVTDVEALVKHARTLERELAAARTAARTFRFMAMNEHELGEAAPNIEGTR